MKCVMSAFQPVDKKSRTNKTREKQNIILSKGLCSLCLKNLNDSNENYHGKSKKIEEDGMYYQITICPGCFSELRAKENKYKEKIIATINRNYLIIRGRI